MPVGGTAFFGMNQHPRITTTYLNQVSRRGDPGPGLNVGGRTDFVNGGQVGMSGMIAQPYAGFIGGKTTITHGWAQQLADPTVGPLYGGVYMYLQYDPKATVPLVRGNFVFYLDEPNYIVTLEPFSQPASGPWPGASRYHYKQAGVVVSATDPGNWKFFQVLGIAMVKFTYGMGWTYLGDLIQANQNNSPVDVGVSSWGGLHQFSIGTVVLTTPQWGGGEVSPVQLNLAQGLNF